MKPNDIFSKLKMFLSAQKLPQQPAQENAQTIESLLHAFGGAQNIVAIDACLTRLRITVENLSQVQTEEIQSLGAKGVIIIDHQVQAIFGRSSDKLKQKLTLWLKNK
ncbi:glucose PTS transporter subunit EIIB [Celerinatantimonas sp. MCCC 1A17872]|uniref:glucose PTS transporter subunit EIIB n=1 Tax=Celerinatantimonas sp. MCCC 1A17872 TaxID=3177514 RepID=UPI0038C70CBA